MAIFSFNALRSSLARNRGNIRNALLQGGRVASGLVVMRLAALVVSAVVARTAGVKTLGEFTFFLTLFVLTAEILYAFDMAYIREAGVVRSEGGRRRYLRLTMLAKIAFIVALVLLMAGASGVISAFMGKENAGEVVKWSVIAGALNALFMSVTVRYQQQQRFGVSSLLQPLPNMLVMLGVFAVALSGLLDDISDVTRIYMGVGLLLGLIGVVYVILLGGQGSDGERLPGPVIRAYLGTMVALLLAKALSLVSIRLDVFFLGKWLDYEDLGLYGVALRVSVLVSLITVVTGTLILPRATEAMADAKRFRRYLGLSGLYVGMQILVATILLLLLKPIIRLIFGEEFEAAAWVTGVLILQTLFTAFGGPFQALMQCGMPPATSVMIAAFRMAISVPLLWYAVPRYGLEGAAVAVAAVAFMVSVLQFALVWNRRPRMPGRTV